MSMCCSSLRIVGGADINALSCTACALWAPKPSRAPRLKRINIKHAIPFIGCALSRDPRKCSYTRAN